MNLQILSIMYCILKLACNYQSLAQLNQKIQSLQNRDRIMTASRCRSYDQDLCSLKIESKYQKNHVQQYSFLNKNCIFSNSSESFIFQTFTKLYVAINNLYSNSFQIYSQKCEMIYQIKHISIKHVVCDRGICQNGMVYLISKNNELLLWEDTHNYTVNILKKDLGLGSQIVGVIARIKSNSKVELFIAQSNGIIKMFNEIGDLKLTITTQISKQLTKMIDHHPYPIILSKNYWISFLDTGKYLEVKSDCPFIEGIYSIIYENPYSTNAFAVSSSYIFNLQVKMTKKNCKILSKFPFSHSNIKNYKSIYYKNSIFTLNSVINLTQSKIYKIQGCTNFSDFSLGIDKSQSKDTFISHGCCFQQKCEVIVYRIKKQNESSLVLIIILITFIIVIAIPCKRLFKKRQPNLHYDQEIKLRAEKFQPPIDYYLPTQSKKSKKKK